MSVGPVWSVEKAALDVSRFSSSGFETSPGIISWTYLVDTTVTSVRSSAAGTIGTGGAGLAGSSSRRSAGAGNGYRWPSALLHVVFPALFVGVLLLLLSMVVVVVAQLGEGKLDQAPADDPAVSDRVAFALADINTRADSAPRRVGSDGRRGRGREVGGAR